MTLADNVSRHKILKHESKILQDYLELPGIVSRESCIWPTDHAALRWAIITLLDDLFYICLVWIWFWFWSCIYCIRILSTDIWSLQNYVYYIRQVTIFSWKLLIFFLFMKTYVVGAHQKCLSKVLLMLLMNTYNIYLYREIRKTFFWYHSYLELCIVKVEVWVCVYYFIGVVSLKSSLTHSNKFESGNMDEFLVEAVNIGELKKIKWVDLN